MSGMTVNKLKYILEKVEIPEVKTYSDGELCDFALGRTCSSLPLSKIYVDGVPYNICDSCFAILTEMVNILETAQQCQMCGYVPVAEDVICMAMRSDWEAGLLSDAGWILPLEREYKDNFIVVCSRCFEKIKTFNYNDKGYN